MSATPIGSKTRAAIWSGHRPLAELEAGLRALPPAPKDVGWPTHIIRRLEKNVREWVARG